MEKNTLPSVSLFDLEFFSGKKSDLIASLKRHIQEKKSLLTVCTPNPEQIVQSATDVNLLHALQEADLRIPDGVGVILASRILFACGKIASQLSERITGVDVVQELLNTEASVLVIGGRAYASDRVITEKKLPLFHLTIPADSQGEDGERYWIEGYRDVRDQTPEETGDIQSVIELLKPQVVCVAFGAPLQEVWLQKNRTFLEKNNVSVAITVGGAFDFILGKVPRAPKSMQTLGLEWLFRLFQQPWRWKRQLRLVQFVHLVGKQLI